MFTSFQVAIPSAKEAAGLLACRQDYTKTTEQILTETWMEDGSQPRIIPIPVGVYLDKETDFFVSLSCCEMRCSFLREPLMDLRDKDWRVKETVETLSEVCSAQSVHQNPSLCFSLLSRSRRHCVLNLCFTATGWQDDIVVARCDE